jgi:hypothetical protein
MDENSFNNNDNNNIESREIGVDCNIIDNDERDHEIDNYNNNINNNNININDTNQNQSNQLNENEYNNREEEEEIEDEEPEEDEEDNDDNNNNINLVPKENFSQQVDFLFHPDNPEWQTIDIPPKKKNPKKIIKKTKSKSNLNKKNGKNKKSKSKNKKNKRNKIIQKIRPEFNLCTKIAPQPKTESLFYGKKEETRYEKQCKERAQKIAEYEENFSRQKEIYKAKRKKEEEELKNRYNYLKSRTSNNFYNSKNPSQNGNEDISKYLKNITKIDYPNTDIRNYECNPQKYDKIIHSLLSEISEIKFQRKKENEEFVNQIKRLQNDLDENKDKKNKIKKRPKSGNKIKINKKKSNKNNNIFNMINNYYKPYKSRQKTGNKLKNQINNSAKKKTIENEIPINTSKNSTKNDYYQKEKERIIKDIQDLENLKNMKRNEIIEQNNNINNIDNNYNNNFNYNYNLNPSNSPSSIVIPSINQNQSQNIMNYNNIIYNPVQFNVVKNINPKALDYQDKMQILTELNNNISKFTSGIPKLVNKVNQTLDKIYGNTDNPIKKAINNHPFVTLASKTAFQMIKANSNIIIENMIDDLLIDCVYDLQMIEEARKENLKRNNLMMYLNEAFNKLNIISQNEQEILNNYNIKSRRK